MYTVYIAIISCLISFITAVLMGKYLIPVFRSVKLGQKILDIGPRWHKSKEGTPMMGGLFFIGGTLLACTVMLFTYLRDSSDLAQMKLLLTLTMAILFAVVGFLDDYVKFFKKQNKGLSATQKLIMQFLIAAGYIAAMRWFGLIRTELVLPFISSEVFLIDLNIFYYLLAVVGIVFTINAVNFADGIDGLLGSIMLIVCATFGLIAFMTADDSLMAIASAVFGGSLGFLVFNFHPAKVFMGDTGSFFLGAIVCGFAFWLDEGCAMLLVILFGIIFYIEIISVMIQVTSFKLTGKRVFKMSPIHHHFEMSKWSEWKIVGVFALITIVGCASAVLGLMTTYDLI